MIVSFPFPLLFMLLDSSSMGLSQGLCTNKLSFHEHHQDGKDYLSYQLVLDHVLILFLFDHIVIILFSYSVITIISVHNGSYASFPFKTVFMTLGLFTVICLPLQIVGTLLGRAYNGNPNYPCRTSALPSIIPSSRFYSNPRTIRLVSGVLPFGCIFIEVFFLFASIWSYKYYHVYGFLIAIICNYNQSL